MAKIQARRGARMRKSVSRSPAVRSKTTAHQAERQHAADDAAAYSADGREFSYEASLSSDIEVGGWVTLTTPGKSKYLGRVITEEIVTLPDVPWAADHSRSAGGGGIPPRVRRTAGNGLLLAKEERQRRLVPTAARDTFDDASMAPAEGPLVERYLDSMAGKGARLRIGTVDRCADAPAAILRAQGFNRHTFLCGQSGSGKTYALGLLIEQILLHTELKISIIDPNSDFVKLHIPRKDTSRDVARRYRARTQAVHVVRPAGIEGSHAPLRAWFSDVAEAEQAAVLGLDPLSDREEYGAFSEIAESFGGQSYAPADILRRAEEQQEEISRQLALRIKNLRISDWAVWASKGQPTSNEVLRDSSRAVVIDIGTLASAREKAVTAAAVLGRLWRNRESRTPRLIVIDEAHNVCPSEPTSAIQANATEYCINIAAEGRKFGLYLLLSTQRPQKVHRNILSQCDNLVLMRMNSRADVAELSDVFSFIPRPLLDESTRFRQGEVLFGGNIVPTPLFARVSGRISQEGGADVPTDWAS